MALAVSRQKRDVLACQPPDNVRLRWSTPRCVQPDFFLGFEARHRVQSAAANDTYLCLQSSSSPLSR